jgi:hypothetical protein
MATQKFIQAKKTKLSGSGVTATATSIGLNFFTTPDGTEITDSELGTTNYGTLEPGTSKEEIISFTGVTQNGDGTATLTGVTRGLGFTTPYTAVASNRQSHAGNTVFVLSNNPQMYDDMSSNVNDETITGKFTFPGGGDADAPVSGTVYAEPTDDLEYASKKYIDDIAIAGSPKATEAVYGIAKLSSAAASPTEPVVLNNEEVSATSAANKVVKADSEGKIHSAFVIGGTSSGLVADTNGTKVKLKAASGLTMDTDGLSVDSGTTADKIVKLDGSAKLPAVDGSQLTSIPVFQNFVVASDNLKTSADTERDDGESSSYVLKKSIQVIFTGTYRIKFDLKCAFQTTGYGRIYKNGVAVGTERTNPTTGYTTFSEDLTFNEKDYIQLYIKGGGGKNNKAFIQNFRLYYDISKENTNTVITD